MKQVADGYTVHINTQTETRRLRGGKLIIPR